MRGKQLLVLLIVGAVALFVIKDPDSSADLTGRLLGELQDAGEAFMTYLRQLTS